MHHPILTLSNLLDGIIVAGCLPELEVTGLALDTRVLVAGEVFVAVGGLSRSAQSLVGQAIDKGASCVLLETEDKSKHGVATVDHNVYVVQLYGLKSRVGEIFARFYMPAISGLPLYGVTGTNGKTSVAYFIAQLFTLLTGAAQGVIGTLGRGSINELSGSSHTTPDLASIYAALTSMRERGFASVSMEVSSHALDQGRVSGLPFRVCIFTNLSRDHLDYHETMEKYAAAKELLFRLNPLASPVINIDDTFGQLIFDRLNVNQRATVISYGIENHAARLQATSLTFGLDGVSGVIRFDGVEKPFQSSLMGEFNVLNLLAAIAVPLAEGIDLDAVVACIEKLKPVPGRMEKVVCSPYKSCAEMEPEQAAKDRSPLVIVDYAHTPDALDNALRALKKHSAADLWCVFGCGGDRDKGKRPLMGAAAASLADRLVITSDNPRSEKPAAIIEDILAGVGDVANVVTETNREKAICYAIESAGNDDVLLLAGKGHEDYQEANGKRIYFSDVDCARQALSRRVLA